MMLMGFGDINEQFPNIYEYKSKESGERDSNGSNTYNRNKYCFSNFKNNLQKSEKVMTETIQCSEIETHTPLITDLNANTKHSDLAISPLYTNKDSKFLEQYKIKIKNELSNLEG